MNREAQEGRRSVVLGRPRDRLAWLGLFCLAWCSAASALSRDGDVHDLRHTSWGPKEGAPSAITALAQSSDGYLWTGSASGLFRFDGLRFTQIDLPRDDRLSSVNVWSLFAPASGGVWIGFTFGGVALLKDGKLTAYTERDGLPPGSVKSMTQDRNGTLWAGTSSGLARLDGSRWQRMGAAQGYSDTQTEALLADSAGALWAASKNKVLVLRAGEKIFHESSVQVVSLADVGIAESPDGQVWLLDEKWLRLLQRNGNGGRRTASSGFKFLFDRDGALWVVPEVGGLRRIARPEGMADTSWSQVKDLSTAADDLDQGGKGSTILMQDREGNIWSALPGGLDRFSEGNVTRVDTFLPDGETTFTAYTAAFAAGDDNALWVVGRNFTALSLRGGKSTSHPEIGFISCATRNDDGSVWLGGSKALWKYESGRFARVVMPAGTDGFEVQAMTQERAGALWISVVRKGVFRWSDSSWTAYGSNQALPKETAVTLATDATGRLWFGYTEGRMASLDASAVTMFSGQSRLPIGNVTAIYGKRSTIWAGGEFGLAFFDGTGFRAVTPEVAGAFNSITGIVETANGDLWLNGRGGIMYIVAKEIRRATEDASYHVHAEVFDTTDGVEGSAARLRPLPSAIEGTDGRLWFLTDVGLYWIDPARIHRNLLPPPVQIESLVVGDRAFAPSTGLKLPERTTAVRIDYVAPSLTMAEKVRYRYKLDGVDDGWQDSQGRRQAFYTNLSPGPHRFHVAAANNDGVWNEAGATLDFMIPPTFVQTAWFVALCVIGAALVFSLLVRFRFLQLAARMRLRFEERIAERERIARELHDTLLQGTQGLILGVQAAANRVSPEEPARALLDRALERADNMMAEGRDRIQNLRIPTDASSDLIKSLSRVGEELANGSSVSFRTIVEGTMRDLQPTAQQEAYVVGREALLNSFRHAQARSIDIEIVYADDDFRIHIRDDGVGIDTSADEANLRPGHWGLKGMRERAKNAGGKLDVWSRSGAGTEIVLTIPAARAYRQRLRSSYWLTIRRLIGVPH